MDYLRENHQTQIDNVYYAIYKDEDGVKDKRIMLSLLGSSNSKECTSTLVREFARIYSLPIHKYNSVDSHFRRYSKWLECRNKYKLIKGLTKHEDNYYMVADKHFYYC